MRTGFSAHGRIDVSHIGQVFVAEVEGPWNEELTKSWIAQLLPLLTELSHAGPIAGITVFRRSMLFTPESLQLMKRAAASGAREFPIVAVAHVIDQTVEGADLMAPVLAEYDRQLWPVQRFAHFAQALRWIESQLALQRR